MKYLALIYSPAGASPAYGSPAFVSHMAAYQAANAVYARDGVMTAGEALQPTSTATTIRVRGGKTETMDGPFAETKEQLGGYYMVECANLDEAIHWAAKIPGAAKGSIEVRPIVVW